LKRLQSLRGTKDLIGSSVHLWEKVELAARRIFGQFGFLPIRTPLIEEVVLFRQSVGEDTDIVTKEMYQLKDRSGLEIALRPEGTASVTRALIEHHLQKISPVNKLYYYGPMFRAERPQAGRLRQFHQIGAETFGSKSVLADLEIMEVMVRFLQDLKVKNFELQLNNLGNLEDRVSYRKALKKFFAGQESALCKDCKDRLKRNALRVLDCKVSGCQPIIQKCPGLEAHVSKESQTNFKLILKMLSELSIPHRVNARMVRGIDYYTQTVFELIHPDLGGPNALAAGGRYDGLVESLGGESTPAVGFALGVERLMMILKDSPDEALKTSSVAVIALGEEAQTHGYHLLSGLRKEGIAAVMDFENRSMKAQMRHADKSGASFVLIIGEKELQSKKFVLKDMRKGKEQEEIDSDKVIANLRSRIESC
jgi:histidyl-tRNA synthetase